MAESSSATEQNSKDRIVDEVVAKVEQRPAVEAPPEEVRSRTEDAVEELIDRPVQSFTPLLAENSVVGGLMAERNDRRSQGTGEAEEADAAERPTGPDGG